MRGYVANTDHDWFTLLRSIVPPVEEVNFWRPRDTTQFHVLSPGEPVFFKLKIPHNAVAGFGYFAHFSVLPELLVAARCTCRAAPRRADVAMSREVGQRRRWVGSRVWIRRPVEFWTARKTELGARPPHGAAVYSSESSPSAFAAPNGTCNVPPQGDRG